MAKEFVALLQQIAVDYLVDVRAILRYHRKPHFNSRSLPKALAVVSIGYHHIAALAVCAAAARMSPHGLIVFGRTSLSRIM
jgi:uncharacterized protein (DUF488 family)